MVQTNADHHHQDGFSKENSPSPSFSTPEAELIALARGKCQLLTEHSLRIIRDTLELRAVTLATFVTEVRPHFRNAIRNPSGFLINFARNFGTLSRPAMAPATFATLKHPSTAGCDECKGERIVILNGQIRPCPKCSTPEFRRDWQQREAAREKRVRALAR